MAQVVKLKRTAVQGKVPTTSSLELGELAINTYDGRIFFEKDNGTSSIQSIVVTDAVITGSINLTGAVTASYFKGDGSNLINLPNADVSQVATVTASFDNQSNVSVTHNFNSRNIIVSVYDTAYSQIIPSSVTLTDSNTADIVLSSAQSGFAVVAKGGHIVSGTLVQEVTEVATVTASFDNQSTISVTHSFGSKNILVSVYDTNDSQIIPSSVVLTNTNTATIGLSSPQSGYVVVAKGGHLVTSTGTISYNNLTDVPAGIISGSSGAPAGTISGSSQISALGYATTGSNTFNGDQTISGSLFISGATELGGNIVPKTARGATLGTLERPFGEIFVSSGSINIASDTLGDPNTTLTNVGGNILVSAGGMRLVGDASFMATTGSFSYLSGSFTHIGAQFNEGDIITTGSLQVSGSTIMIGNNTMTGNTQLTGSVDISGSLTSNGLTYPNIDGTEFSYIQTDGAGNLSFADVATTYDTIHNGEGSSLLAGTPLYVSGANGANPIVYRADASNPLKMPVTYIAAEKIITNGRGILLGEIEGVNTTGYSAGTTIYVAEGGGWSSTRPSGSSSIVQVLGIVTKEGSGGKGLVLNPGPATLPNLQTGNIWVGNSTNQPVSFSTASLATTGSNTFRGTQILSGSIIPAIDNTYDLGSPTYQWKDIYVSSGSLYIDGTKVLGSTGNELQITTDVGQSIKILEAGSDSIILQSADGDIQLKSSGGGNLLFDPTTGLIDVRGTLQIQDGNKITSSGGNSIQFGNDLEITGSINTSGNVNGVNLLNLQSSFNTFTGSSNTALNGLNSYTASLNSAISTSGSNVTILGNLSVAGTQTIVNSTTVQIGDNIIELNGTGATNAGLLVKDATAPNTNSGSLLWDSTNDYWKAGVKDSESKILLAGGDSVVSGSSQIVSILSPLNTFSASVESKNTTLGTYTASIETKNSTLATYTGSLDTKNNTLGTYTSSLETKNSTLATYTGSLETKNSTLATYTGSLETKNSTLATYTGSVNTSITALQNKDLTLATTGSNTFTSNQTITGSLNAVTGNGNSINLRSGNSGQYTILGLGRVSQDLGIASAASTNQFFVGATAGDAWFGSTNGTIGFGNDTTGTATMVIKGGNVGFGLTNPQSQIHLNGTITLTESGFDTVRRHTITHGHSDGSSTNNFVAINVSNGAGTTAERIRVNGSGHVLPGANGTQDLGSTSLRWANLYTNDLHLSNEGKVGGNDVDGTTGNWTIQEGEEHLYIINNKTGKKFKFSLEEIQ